MSDLSAQELVRISKLLVEQRCEYALTEMAKTQQVWGLMGQEGWVLLKTEEEVCMPVWPAKDFAVAWEKDEYPECTPTAIDLDTWLNTWLPGMQKNGSLILVFPVGDEEEGIILSAEEMANYLQEELDELNQANLGHS